MSIAHGNASNIAIEQEANTAEDANDDGGHELTFEEWKRAMIGIASALDLPSENVGKKISRGGSG